jgi:predicted TIM-barrel fold metal-dependent hydrolase
MEDTLKAVKSAEFLSDSDREKILWKNAKEVLKL